MPSECWSIVKSLNDKKMLELEDLKEAVFDSKEYEEKSKEVYGMMGDEDEEEEIKLEMDRIEAEMKIEQSMKSKGKSSAKMDQEIGGIFSVKSDSNKPLTNPFLPSKDSIPPESLFGPSNTSNTLLIN